MENKPQFQVLKRSADFQKLKENGKKVRPCQWLLVSFLENDLEQSRCGWTVPRKVGSAVIRNRLKRWCREFFRHIEGIPSGMDLNVVFLGTNKSQDFFRSLTFPQFQACLSLAMQRMQSIRNR